MAINYFRTANVKSDTVASKLDFRWEGGPFTLGTELFTLTGSRGDGTAEHGYWLNAIHRLKVRANQNRLILQYGKGLASSLGETSDFGAAGDAKTYRVIDELVVNKNPEDVKDVNPQARYSAEFVALFQRATGKQTVQTPGNWISFGMRPICNVSDHVRVALELGHDIIRPDNGDTRRLTKITFAPELAAGRAFMSRPVLRVFMTYATWNRAAADAGVVLSGSSPSPFGDELHGMTYGLQAEDWW